MRAYEHGGQLRAGERNVHDAQRSLQGRGGYRGVQEELGWALDAGRSDWQWGQVRFCNR